MELDWALADKGQTYLESNTVAATTSKQYQDELERFLKFAQPRGLRLTDDIKTNEILLDYLNRLFFVVHQRNKADRLLAAFLHRYPQFGRLGNKKPRSSRERGGV